MKTLDMVKRGGVWALGSGVALSAGIANATGQDYTAITSAIDWSTTITAIMAIFAAIAAVYLAFKGGKLVIHALKGA